MTTRIMFGVILTSAAVLLRYFWDILFWGFSRFKSVWYLMCNFLILNSLSYYLSQMHTHVHTFFHTSINTHKHNTFSLFSVTHTHKVRPTYRFSLSHVCTHTCIQAHIHALSLSRSHSLFLSNTHSQLLLHSHSVLPLPPSCTHRSDERNTNQPWFLSPFLSLTLWTKKQSLVTFSWSIIVSQFRSQRR